MRIISCLAYTPHQASHSANEALELGEPVRWTNIIKRNCSLLLSFGTYTFVTFLAVCCAAVLLGDVSSSIIQMPFSLLDFYDEFVSGIFPRLFRLIHFVDTNDEFAKQENEQRALRIYQIDKHYWLRWFCSPHEYTSKTSDTRMQYESDTFATIHVFAASKSGKMLELYSARVASTMTTMSEANKFACWFFIGSRVRFVSLAETSLLPVRAISFISLSAEENIKREIIHAVARWPHKHWPSSIAIFCTIVVRCPPSALDTLSSAPDLVIFLILFWRLTMSSRWFIINPLREELGHD